MLFGNVRNGEAMRQTNANKRVEAVREAVELLDKGVAELFDSERWREYLTVMSRFHNYSARNCVLIMMQCPQATHVASYNSWKRNFGRQVRKGEKAIRILAPIRRSVTVTETDADTGEERDRERVWMSYKTVPVFDISQTDGEELPDVTRMLEGEVDGYESLIERVSAVSPLPVEFGDIDGSANGYCSYDEGRILVRDDMSELQTLKTLVHEVAHSLLHGKDGEEANADRDAREVQAEGVAFVVCNCLGLDTSDYSFGYVAGWGGDTKKVFEQLEAIRKAASTILDGIAA
jgi:antirestriction protein ArdC